MKEISKHSCVSIHDPTMVAWVNTLYASNLEGERERFAYPPSAKAIGGGIFGTD